MLTVLNEGKEIQLDAEPATQLWVDVEQAETATGWTLKPEGFCKGDVCVPIPSLKAGDLIDGQRVNLSGLWNHMGNPVAFNAAKNAWSLGESAENRNESMRSLDAPDFTLPDLDGKPHSLHDFRRKRVLLITWASW